MIQILYLGSSSVCMELQNDIPYYAEGTYTVSVNGETVLQSDTNVFSLFDLLPDTEYTAVVDYKGQKEEIAFKTASETCRDKIRRAHKEILRSSADRARQHSQMKLDAACA